MADAEQGVSSIVESTKETLTKKVGPLPIWAYGALAMGVLFVYTRQKRRMAPASGATTDGNPPTGPILSDSMYSPGAVGLAQGYMSSTDETNAKERTIYSNDDWCFEGAKALMATHTDNTTVLRRLRQYVANGVVLPTDEYMATLATAEEAIMRIGPPPKPFVPPVEAPMQIGTPSPAQPAAPIGQPNNGKDIHFTLRQFGGSIESAAEHFFGDPTAWTNFRIWDPTGDQGTGWINAESYRMFADGRLGPDSELVVGPYGRIAD